MATSGRGNVEQFKRDMAAMVREKLEVEVPRAVAEIALDLRNQAERNSATMLGHEPGAPDIVRGWHAGPVLGAQDGSPSDDQTSRAELAKWKPGQSIYVWQSVYYAYFHEYGYLPGGGTVPRAPVGFFRAAVEAVGGREVKL